MLSPLSGAKVAWPGIPSRSARALRSASAPVFARPPPPFLQVRRPSVSGVLAFTLSRPPVFFSPLPTLPLPLPPSSHSLLLLERSFLSTPPALVNFSILIASLELVEADADWQWRHVSLKLAEAVVAAVLPQAHASLTATARKSPLFFFLPLLPARSSTGKFVDNPASRLPLAPASPTLQLHTIIFVCRDRTAFASTAVGFISF